MREYHLPFGIEVTIEGPDGSRCGVITSDLRLQFQNEQELLTEVEEMAADALESLILGHAVAGVDIEAPAYVEGLKTAVEAIANVL